MYERALHKALQRRDRCGDESNLQFQHRPQRGHDGCAENVGRCVDQVCGSSAQDGEGRGRESKRHHAGEEYLFSTRPIELADESDGYEGEDEVGRDVDSTRGDNTASDGFVRDALHTSFCKHTRVPVYAERAALQELEEC